MGIVSLFGDITYEGARSVTGPFLALLGASAATVGFVSGLGEFIGYGLRLVSGYIADKSERYWLMTIAGYALMLSIPLLAFAGDWKMAAALIVIERMGKAIRSPARDSILSHATKQMGRGIGFGIHEFLDQMGAIIGPLLFSLIFIFKGEYRDGFKLMLFPALITLALLYIAMRRNPSPVRFESAPAAGMPGDAKAFGKEFWAYTGFIFLSVMGFASFQLLSYHFKVGSVVPDAQIPILYAVAMGVDGITALIIGRVYDRIGLKTLLLIPIATIALPLIAFSKSPRLAFAAASLWGIIMGTHDTIMRAGIADLTHLSRRGIAYGIFNTAYGTAFFLGNILLGYLYQSSLQSLVLFVVIIELTSLPAFFLMLKSARIV
jgi:MFS family permease